MCFYRAGPQSSTSKTCKEPRVRLQREQTIQRDEYSSSSHESFCRDEQPPLPPRGDTLRSPKSRSDHSQADSRDLLTTSCDASMLRSAKELNPNTRPYRKLSLTPNLPRLEQRTSLNNHPLQKHTHKFSTSEDSDLFQDSDQNLCETGPSTTPSPLPPTIITTTTDNKPSDSSSSTTSLKSKGSTGSRVKFEDTSSSGNSVSSCQPALHHSGQHVGSGHAMNGSLPQHHAPNTLSRRTSVSSPSLSIKGPQDQGDRRVRTSSEGADTENVVEQPDKLPELSVMDKRKTFAFKNTKRKQNLLTPNRLTDIGERSDNSDQSFDYGEVNSPVLARPEPPRGTDHSRGDFGGNGAVSRTAHPEVLADIS